MQNRTLYKLKLKKFLVIAFFSVSTLAAADSSLFYGSWGTAAQCSRSLIIPHGTKHHAPFEISESWLKHGDVWCRLEWVNVVSQENGAYAITHGLCGEDDSRAYRLNFYLSGEELTLIWNHELENSSLRRC